jgi:hypothetical protein
MAVGGVLIVLAAVLPWAQHASPFGGGTLSVKGLDLSWGQFALGLGLLTIVAGSLAAIFASAALRRGLAVIGIAAGLAAGGVAIYHASGTTPDLRPAFEKVLLRDRGAMHAGVGQGQGQRLPGTGSQGGSGQTSSGQTGNQAGSGQGGLGQGRGGLGRGFAGSLPTPGAGIWLTIVGGLISLAGGIGAFASAASPTPTSSRGAMPTRTPGPAGPPVPTRPADPTERLQPVAAGTRPTEQIDAPGPSAGSSAGSEHPT